MAQAVFYINSGCLTPAVKPIEHPHATHERRGLFRLSTLVEDVAGWQDNRLIRVPVEQNREPLAGSEHRQTNYIFSCAHEPCVSIKMTSNCQYINIAVDSLNYSIVLT